MTSLDSFKSRKTLTVGNRTYVYYSLPDAEKNGLDGVSALPFSMKVLLENLLRFEDGRSVTKKDILSVKDWLINRGKEEREIAFRRAIRERYPAVSMSEISEGYGTDMATGKLVAAALSADSAIDAVYSIGGGNRAVIAAFEAAARPIRIFVAHDLDADNRALLAERKLTFVLHHDLRTDARMAFRAFLNRRVAPGRMTAGGLSAVEIITPCNVPAEL